jgi:hypothetical protein
MSQEQAIVFRGCLKSSLAGETAEQQPGHGQVDDRLRGSSEVLVVLAEPPEPAQPREGALHHPPAGHHRKGGHDRRRGIGRKPASSSPAVAALDNVERDAPLPARPVQERPAVTTVGPTVPQPGKAPPVQLTGPRLLVHSYESSGWLVVQVLAKSVGGR